MPESVDVANGAGFRAAHEGGVAIPLTPDAAQYVAAVDAAGDLLATIRRKGLQTQTISSGGATSSTAVTLAAGAVPIVGQIVYFTDATFESRRVTKVVGQVVTIDVALASVSTHSAIQWDIFADNGPRNNAITPGQIMLEGLALYDSSAVAYYLAQGVAGALKTALTAAAVGGATKYKASAGAKAALKASAGTLYGLYAINSSGADAYVQLFDVASASVTLGTTVPDLELYVPTTGLAASLPLPPTGAAFATAITIGSTTTEGGATASAAGVKVFALYA